MYIKPNPSNYVPLSTQPQKYVPLTQTSEIKILKLHQEVKIDYQVTSNTNNPIYQVSENIGQTLSQPERNQSGKSEESEKVVKMLYYIQK